MNTLKLIKLLNNPSYKTINQTNYDFLYRYFIVPLGIIGIILIVFDLYVYSMRIKIVKKRIRLSDLINGQHEVSIIDKNIVETISIHLDGKIGLKILADMNNKLDITRGSYIINQTIDSILAAHINIKNNQLFAEIKYLTGRSIHIKPFHKRLKKIGIN